MPYKGLSPVYGSENAVSDYTKTLTDNDSYIHSVQHAKDIHLASLPPQEAPDVSFNVDNFGNVGSLVMDDTSEIPTMDGSENNDRYLGASPNLKLTDENEGVLMNLFNAFSEKGQRLATPVIAPFFNNPVVSGVTLGITDAGQGILDIARDFNNFIVEGNGGEGVSEDDWAKIPEILASNPDSTTEGVVRGLTQFMSIFAGLGGMQSVVKVGSETKQFFQQMLAAGLADASFDPELGNISTLLNELDFIDEDNPIGAVTEFLGAPIGEDADAAERLAFRVKSVLEGAGLAVGVQGLMEAFKFLKRTMMKTDPDKFKKILKLGSVPAAFDNAQPEQQTTEDFIKSFEGYRDEGYYATESEQEAGLVTAGYGSTNRVAKGEQITEAQAEEFFQEDLAVAETAVDKLVTTELSSNQRAAIVSLVFNVGQGNFKKSKALKALNKGDIDTFLKEAFDPKIGFVKSGGKVLNGLVTRRQAEKQLFLGGTA